MISAVVLTHNDESSIQRTLKSISWCDEMIVIDDASADSTEEIAKKAGAKVFKRTLEEDFAAQRNFGLSKAKGEWVLFVDSDEVVPNELQKEIKKAVTSSYNGFYIKRRDFWGGKCLGHGEQGRMTLLRLAKKSAGNWERPVHEVWKVAGPVGQLNSPLHHYPHPNVAQFIEEINRYSTLKAKYLHNKKTQVTIFQIIGYPLAKFLINYVWHLGFLDGTQGAIVAIMMSFHSFLTRGKLYLLNTKHA